MQKENLKERFKSFKTKLKHPNALPKKEKNVNSGHSVLSITPKAAMAAHALVFDGIQEIFSAFSYKT